MDEFLATALAPPTLIFTVLLGLALLYWVFVLVGALELDSLDPDAGAEHGLQGFADMLSALRLRSAPLTVVSSALVLFAWLGSYFGMRYAAPLLPVDGVLAGSLVAIASLLLAWPLTALATRPFASLLHVERARANAELIGKVVVVKTGSVDARFGQAELHDGQAGLLLNVRCEQESTLARGDKALIIGWDEKAHAFEIEPLDEVLHEIEAPRDGAGRTRRS